MSHDPCSCANMNCVGLIVLFVVAAAAVPAEIPAGGENIVFRCVVNKEFNIVVKEKKTPFYLCSAPDGDSSDHFLMAAPIEGLESTFETTLPKVEAVKLRELSAVIRGAPRPKRSPQFGFGGSGANANAQAGSFGGGGGFGTPFGGFGGGVGGSYSNANAQAGAGGFGGGNGFYGK